jgi:ECF sigma factor
MDSPDEITELIAMWQGGDGATENALFNALHQKLRGMAINCLRGEGAKRPLGAITLVQEAYFRLHRPENLFVNDPNHLLSLVGRVMR